MILPVNAGPMAERTLCGRLNGILTVPCFCSIGSHTRIGCQKSGGIGDPFKSSLKISRAKFLGLEPLPPTAAKRSTSLASDCRAPRASLATSGPPNLFDKNISPITWPTVSGLPLCGGGGGGQASAEEEAPVEEPVLCFFLMSAILPKFFLYGIMAYSYKVKLVGN